MLNVDQDLVRELRELCERGMEADAAIVLGPGGWECGVWTDRPPSDRLIAITSDAFEGVGCEEGDDLDDAGVRAVLGDADYRIRAEGGGDEEPDDETAWAVVTGTVIHETRSEEDLPWRDGWWFDTGRATLVVEEDEEALRAGSAHSIWVTERGSWLLRLSTRQLGAVDGQWFELDRQTAAEMIYEVDATLLTAEESDLPLLARAARAARLLADLMSYGVPEDGRLTADVQVWRDREDAIGHVHDAHAIGELVRGRLQPAVRGGRQSAAVVVRMAHDGNDTHTANALGMSRTTFLGLIN
ncbi:hypothetical protein ACFQ61_08550 [Streptomyces sp. NPDC056500]|uniref:hypothetical protein n=1 Tax=Streptomyces sp. NPDC056500 TaxID=3345840 RepID=UPI003673E2EA